MNAPLSKSGPANAFEFRLLNSFQRDFPLTPRPFAVLAAQLNSDEMSVIASLQDLQRRGLISRVGAVFRPNAVGASALAALAVAPERLAEVAAIINARVEINHNYEREHHYNLWFVANAASAENLQLALHEIELACDCGSVLILPMLEDFHIDLGFDLAGTAACRSVHHKATPAPQTYGMAQLADAERALLAVLQHGLPLVPQPYAALGVDEQFAIAALARWTGSGVIKRFGIIVRHHELGFTANAMVVWNVPDDLVSALGRRIAASGRVTLCYRRPRLLPQWPYNLFCMIHGKDRLEVEARIAALADACEMADFPHDILFSQRRFKQRGAHYVHPVIATPSRATSQTAPFTPQTTTMEVHYGRA